MYRLVLDMLILLFVLALGGLWWLLLWVLMVWGNR